MALEFLDSYKIKGRNILKENLDKDRLCDLTKKEFELLFRYIEILKKEKIEVRCSNYKVCPRDCKNKEIHLATDASRYSCDISYSGDCKEDGYDRIIDKNGEITEISYQEIYAIKNNTIL